jgi:hypothetical protein
VDNEYNYYCLKEYLLKLIAAGKGDLNSIKVVIRCLNYLHVMFFEFTILPYLPRNTA